MQMARTVSERAGQALFEHIQQYNSKGFQIKRVTSDGEPTIKAARSELSSLGVGLNVLGHGSLSRPSVT
jgi:hypothetical protein